MKRHNFGWKIDKMFKQFFKITVSILLLVSPCFCDQDLVFKMNWPKYMTGDFIFQYGLKSFSKAKGESIIYYQKNSKFKVNEVSKGYRVLFFDDKVVKNGRSPKAKDIVQLLSEIDFFPNLLISKKGILDEIEIEAYRKELLKRLNSNAKNYTSKIVENLKGDLDRNLISTEFDYNKNLCFYLLSYWKDRSFNLKKGYSGSSSVMIPQISKEKVKFEKHAKLIKIEKTGSKIFATLEFREYISQDELYVALGVPTNNILSGNHINPQDLFDKLGLEINILQEKISKQKYRYVINHLLLTELSSLIPHTYVKTTEIVLPDFENYEIQKYTFQYIGGTKNE